MAANTFGEILRLTTFGESHGQAIGGVLDGMPSGILLDTDAVQHALDRRRPGQSGISTPRKESDTVKILSGVFEGLTTGTPIGLLIENENKNHDTQDNKPKFSFRPAETPIEDFPLAEEEDETPTSDGYGYSDFEADDGDDDYPEEKLSFRERLAKRRAETEASNAAEQAAFDEDDES